MASNAGNSSAIRGINIPLKERMTIFDSLPRKIRDQLNDGLYDWTPESVARQFNGDGPQLTDDGDSMVIQFDTTRNSVDQILAWLRSHDYSTMLRDRVMVWGMTLPSLVGYNAVQMVNELGGGIRSDEESLDWSD